MSAVESKFEDDEWSVDCSDEEKYKIEIHDMIQLYNEIAKRDIGSEGSKIKLEWKPPRRRRSPPRAEPSSEKHEEEKKVAESDISMQDENATTAAPGFDFDEISSELKSVRPARKPSGTPAPRSNKRVARLDKIMDDMRRHERMDKESSTTPSKSAQSPRGTSPRTPQNRRSVVRQS